MLGVTERMKWGVEQRLEFIEFQLFWEDGLNRADITERFGVSVPQASKDLSQYQQLAPENVWYDKSERKYRATETFRPIFSEPDSSSYLVQLFHNEDLETSSGARWLINPPESDQIVPLTRKVSAQILRAIAQAIREDRPIRVEYQSMSSNSAGPERRTIHPHAFGYDGMRWHVRAFCFRDQKYKDFLLTRMLRAEYSDATPLQGHDDKHWNSFFQIELVPNPKLNDAQKVVIEAEYGMCGGLVTATIRKAMLYYFWKRFRFDVSKTLDDPRETTVVIRNYVALREALAEAMS